MRLVSRKKRVDVPSGVRPESQEGDIHPPENCLLL